jgi:hypothetical protein
VCGCSWANGRLWDFIYRHVFLLIGISSNNIHICQPSIVNKLKISKETFLRFKQMDKTRLNLKLTGSFLCYFNVATNFRVILIGVFSKYSYFFPGQEAWQWRLRPEEGDGEGREQD